MAPATGTSEETPSLLNVCRLLCTAIFPIEGLERAPVVIPPERPELTSDDWKMMAR